MGKDRWKGIRDYVRSHGAVALKSVDPRKIPTAEWVRTKCQFGCGGYGQCLTCPPHSPTPERTRRLLDEYSAGFLIHWGNNAGSRDVLGEIERHVFLQGYYKALVMASGPCELCRECNVDEPCRYPSRARPSMEACGIDVFQTVRTAGLPIQVLTCHEETPNFYSLLLVE